MNVKFDDNPYLYAYEYWTRMKGLNYHHDILFIS